MAQRQLKSFLQLIDNVYQAAFDDSRWRNVAPQIAETFNSTSTNLQIQNVGTSSQILSATDNVNAKIDDYRAHYWQCDIWVERAMQRIGISRVGSSKDIVTDVEFQETEFYRDWCRHLDVFYVVGAVFPAGPGELGVLGIHRPRSAGSYDEYDKQVVSRFMPHLQRALRIREALAQAAVQRGVSVDTLNRCDTAVLLVVADGSIVYANRHAEALLTAGTVLGQRNGKLTAVRQTEHMRLSALIREATRMSGDRSVDGILSLKRVNQPPLNILVAPFRMSLAGYPAAGAIVFVRDPARSISALSAIQSLFQMTPTEARIAQGLANGMSLAEIAAKYRASPQTVRKQLKAIFAKTGTNRQAQCVAAILRSIAPIVRD